MNELELIKAIYEMKKKADIEEMKLLLEYLIKRGSEEDEK